VAGTRISHHHPSSCNTGGRNKGGGNRGDPSSCNTGHPGSNKGGGNRGDPSGGNTDDPSGGNTDDPTRDAIRGSNDGAYDAQFAHLNSERPLAWRQPVSRW